ncbi:MAG TPA: MEMAR_RS02690 family S-layer glycoprotein [Methanoregulaceae archaeon]|nr:MEMAR_RS02690 family S-layer glycoprotein [Methanoregulaceae archaeon]
MTKRLSIALMMCVALVLLAGTAVSAYPKIQNVPVGGDVFIGEQGLVLPVPAGTVLSWYTGSQTVGQSAPAATVTVTDPNNFYVAPQTFVGHAGNWYVGSTNTVAVVANDPSQVVNAWDQQAGKIVTGKSVPAGDFINFRLETNLNTIPTQRNSTTGFVDIKVKTSDGTVYTALYQDLATQIALTGQSVNAMPYFWVVNQSGPYGWATGIVDGQGSRIYKAGVYTFWTECNLNGMKDNYKDASGNDYTGKTISTTQTVTLASDTVKIQASKDSVVRGNPFSVTITGRPNTAYYLWVKGTSSMSGNNTDAPPFIAASQDNVAQDQPNNIVIGQYQYQGGGGLTIQQDVPKYNGDVFTNGTSYYCQVTLSNSGTRTVGWTTTKDTKDKKYTIHVERAEPATPVTPPAPNRQFKSDEVDISVQKGAVTIVAAGDQQYFLGEEIKLTGTNSETDFTYLFITGPNLPTAGGQLTDPRTAVIPGQDETFTPQDVLEDNTWSYKWQTANLNIDAGTYTVYAVATAVNRDNLANAQYATVSIIIRKPFVSAVASQSVVAAGDKLYVRGTAQGQPTQGVAIWIMGKNFISYATESVNTDGTFEYEVTEGTTANMAAGQYFVVVQHPMYNDRFDVFPDNPNSPQFVLGAYPVFGNSLFKVGGAGSLQGSDAAEALVQALNNPSVDDTYTKLQFLVEVPKITIAPIGDHQVGDKFTIQGTTNLAVDDQILVQVTSSSFQPTEKTQSGEFSGSTGTVKVVAGTQGFNTWSFPVDASSFKPDEYICQAEGITVTGAQASTLFNVVEFKPTPVPTTVPPTTVAPVTTAPPTAPPTTVPTAKPTTQPGFGALIAVIGLGAVAFLVVRKH